MGGKYVFDFLSRQLIIYGSTQGLIRAVVTGSSAELLFKLERTSVASGERMVGYALQDPPEDEVQKALVKVGYSENDAARIVQLCGTRMRQLEGPLRHGRLVPLNVFIQQHDEAAVRQYEDFFTAMGELQDGGGTSAAVIKLLDRIEASEANHSNTPPSWKNFPPDAISADISRLVFIGLDGRARFQSRVHRRVWGTFRATLSVPVVGTTTSSESSSGSSGGGSSSSRCSSGGGSSSGGDSSGGGGSGGSGSGSNSSGGDSSGGGSLGGGSGGVGSAENSGSFATEADASLARSESAREKPQPETSLGVGVTGTGKGVQVDDFKL